MLDDVVNEAFGLGEKDELGEGFCEGGCGEKAKTKCNRRDAECAEEDAERDTGVFSRRMSRRLGVSAVAFIPL